MLLCQKFQLLLCQKKIIKIFIDQQDKGFQRSIYWNEYKAKEQNEDADHNVFKYINLYPSFQGVNRLFVMAHSRADNEPNRNSRQKYYLPRIDLKNIMLLLMDEIFMIIQLKAILKNIEN